MARTRQVWDPVHGSRIVELTPEEEVARDAEEATAVEQMLRQKIVGIKTLAAQKIIATGHDWMALREVTDPTHPVPAKIKNRAKAIRDASDAIELEIQGYLDANNFQKAISLDILADPRWPE